MGYTLRIGNAMAAHLEADIDRVHVKVISEEGAPAFPGDYAIRINERLPDYSAWNSFAGQTNLKALFFNEKRGLLAQHPGCAVLEPRHLHEVQSAIDLYRTRFPNAAPRCDASTEDAHLARLLWLEWWMDWALKNCERPAVYNC